jgi:hypothetical protein
MKRLLLALWVGSGAFLIAVAAPVAFRWSPSSTIAADLVGAMLTRWHYIAILLPLLLLGVELRRNLPRQRVRVVLLTIAVLLAALQGFADLRVRALRRDTPIPISELPKDDPLRRHFGLLHGISALLMLSNVLVGAAVIVLDRDDLAPQPVPEPDEIKITI